MATARERRRRAIYQSRWHLAATLAFVLLPFLFLSLFAEVSRVTISQLWSDLGNSLWRLVLAYFIAVVLAWLWAISFYHGRRAIVALPIFDVLQSFPTFAVLPLATYALGASNTTVVFFLVITIIWPIFFSIVSSLKLTKRDWEEAVEIYGLEGWQYLRWYLWPASVPGLITGSIIGLGEGWEALVATEMLVGVPLGLGPFFQHFATDTTLTALGIFGLLLLIFSVNKLIWLPLLERSHRMMEE